MTTKTPKLNMYTLRFSPFVDREKPAIMALLELNGMMYWNTSELNDGDVDMVVEAPKGALDQFRQQVAGLKSKLFESQPHVIEAKDTDVLVMLNVRLREVPERVEARLRTIIEEALTPYTDLDVGTPQFTIWEPRA